MGSAKSTHYKDSTPWWTLRRGEETSFLPLNKTRTNYGNCVGIGRCLDSFNVFNGRLSVAVSRSEGVLCAGYAGFGTGREG